MAIIIVMDGNGVYTLMSVFYDDLYIRKKSHFCEFIHAVDVFLGINIGHSRHILNRSYLLSLLLQASKLFSYFLCENSF